MIRWLALVLAIPFAFAAACYAQAIRTPVVRRTAVAMPDWPTDAPPLRVALISDIHIGSAAMGPMRLRGVVDRINALHPDVVLIAGDFISGHRRNSARHIGPAMVAPLSQLRAPLGTVAVLGNHDWVAGADAVRTQLERAHVRVLANDAISLGPIALGGLDDSPTGHDDLDATERALRALPGAPVLLAHSPDIAAKLAPDLPLLLAGHTHCGQIVLPLYGPLASVTRFGERYRCGVRREHGRTVVVTAGLGTSGGPFRFGAPPDLWLVKLGPGG